MSIYKNLEEIKMIALHLAKEHSCNYNVILQNPGPDGKFNPSGSTYEFVADSYFNKDRPFTKLLHKTDDLLKEKTETTSRPGKHFEDDGAYMEEIEE